MYLNRASRRIPASCEYHILNVLHRVLGGVDLPDSTPLKQMGDAVILIGLAQQAAGDPGMHFSEWGISRDVHSEWVGLESWKVRHLRNHHHLYFSWVHFYQVFLWLRTVVQCAPERLLRSCCFLVLIIFFDRFWWRDRWWFFVFVHQFNAQSSKVCTPIDAVQVLEAGLIEDDVVLLFLDLGCWQ